MSYIEKEKLIKADIASIENRVRHAFNQGYDLGFKDGKEKAKPLEQEPKIGHWIKIHPIQNNDDGDYMCSECRWGGLVYNPTNYCPNCGVRMVDPQKSEDKE